MSACGDDGGDDSAGPATTEAAASSSTTEGATPTSEPAVADGEPVPSPGCTGEAATDEEVRVQHDVAGTDDGEGGSRFYLLTAPATDEPVPLVLDFHGLAEGAQAHTQQSMMGELGLTEGFATAFPNGTGSPVRWSVGDLDSPEPAFVDEVLDDIGATRCIDTSRVYAMGLSNGAMMTSVLACTRADRIAAFAPVAGLTTYEGCEPDAPVSILAFHGTADPILLFNGGVGDLGVISGGAPPDQSNPARARPRRRGLPRQRPDVGRDPRVRRRVHRRADHRRAHRAHLGLPRRPGAHLRHRRGRRPQLARQRVLQADRRHRRPHHRRHRRLGGGVGDVPAPPAGGELIPPPAQRASTAPVATKPSTSTPRAMR